MTDNTQSRKWTMTINNPKEHGFDHDNIRLLLNRFCPDYYCMQMKLQQREHITPMYICIHSLPYVLKQSRTGFPLLISKRLMAVQGITETTY